MPVTGRMTIHGVTRTIEVTLDAVQRNGRIGINGTIPVRLEDYQIENPLRGRLRGRSTPRSSCSSASSAATCEGRRTLRAVTPDEVAALRARLDADGLASLVVDDLRADDLERLSWSGLAAPTCARWRSQLERVAAGDVEYLVVRGARTATRSPRPASTTASPACAA